jgi:hypothetical protein
MFSALSILYRFFVEISEQPFIRRRNFPGHSRFFSQEIIGASAA